KSFPWLEWSPEALGGKLISLPIREDIPENIQGQLIVELYSK
ncbi:MAG: 30S ribosomal protein S4, partial [Bacteroidetes bacterium]